jgi:hypothetical protein
MKAAEREAAFVVFRPGGWGANVVAVVELTSSGRMT